MKLRLRPWREREREGAHMIAQARLAPLSVGVTQPLHRRFRQMSEGRRCHLTPEVARNFFISSYGPRLNLNRAGIAKGHCRVSGMAGMAGMALRGVNSSESSSESRLTRRVWSDRRCAAASQNSSGASVRVRTPDIVGKCARHKLARSPPRRRKTKASWNKERKDSHSHNASNGCE